MRVRIRPTHVRCMSPIQTSSGLKAIPDGTCARTTSAVHKAKMELDSGHCANTLTAMPLCLLVRSCTASKKWGEHSRPLVASKAFMTTAAWGAKFCGYCSPTLRTPARLWPVVSCTTLDQWRSTSFAKSLEVTRL
ncbi:oxidoreductase-like motif protein [Ranid herpesvirus 3]|uniref:Oxidoreductase-like motif protein n=1 Tax=Ranid herpesvirus 3 TaxID=1987509 RepID=A0A1X9T5L6_9VIRU|nr:oxidoreductase-like motif protein [Ranid herpesvirus 3]ARR28990.1 oxidoreductase-like motif protein [Ranid herpesvirus 3]